MLLFDARTDVSRHAQDVVNGLSKTIWLILGAFVPAAMTAAVKGIQDRSRTQRSQHLTDRISALSKSISELPEATPAGEAPITPRQALTAELNLVVAELYLLQNRVKHNVRLVSVNAMTRFRAAFLLFKPRGTTAVLLHSAFYLYAAVFLFCAAAVVIPSDDTSSSPDTHSAAPAPPNASASRDNSQAAAQQQDTASRRRPAPSGNDQAFFHSESAGEFFAELAAYILMVAVASIPLLVFRHYAAKIHRQQCLADGGQAVPSTGAPVAAAAAAPN